MPTTGFEPPTTGMRCKQPVYQLRHNHWHQYTYLLFVTFCRHKKCFSLQSFRSFEWNPFCLSRKRSLSTAIAIAAVAVILTFERAKKAFRVLKTKNEIWMWKNVGFISMCQDGLRPAAGWLGGLTSHYLVHTLKYVPM